MAYAWYWCAAGAEVLGAVTTQAMVTSSVAATGTQICYEPDCERLLDRRAGAGRTLSPLFLGEISSALRSRSTVTGSTNPNPPGRYDGRPLGLAHPGTMANGSTGALTASGVSIVQFDSDPEGCLPSSTSSAIARFW